jgi:DNA polymerase-4
VASDWNKPDGQFVVRPEEVDAFVAALPVGRIFGVGKVTAARMNALGVHTCGDLRGWSLGELGRAFGSFGAALHKLCRGIDERPVAPARVRKSFSVETTYRHDLPDLAACRVALLPLVAEFSHRLAATHGLPPVNKAFVKVKFDDFTQTTAECGASRPDETVWAALLETAWRRGSRAVRLLGVGVRFGEGPPQQDQLGLFGPHIDMESGAV